MKAQQDNTKKDFVFTFARGTLERDAGGEATCGVGAASPKAMRSRWRSLSEGDTTPTGVSDGNNYQRYNS